jgi:hypothetical protein
MIGGDVSSAGPEEDRFRKINLSPAVARFVREVGLSEQVPLSAPEAADLGPCVLRTLLEAHTQNPTKCGTLKLDAYLDGAGIVPVHICRCVDRTEQA